MSLIYGKIRRYTTRMQNKKLLKENFDFLLEMVKELKVRQARNSQYSMRSFARDLNVSITALSEVLGAKRKFSKKNAQKVIEKLGWSPYQAQTLINHKSSNSKSADQTKRALLIQDDHFRVISEWYYLVILNLAKIKNQSAAPEAISAQLGISIQESGEALQRLIRLGFVKIECGKLIRQTPTLNTTNEVPSSAVRKYHRQNFIVAENAQEHVDFSRRQISSFTVATDPQRVQRAKKMLVRFMDRLSETLESNNPTEVYTVSVQLFPAKIERGEQK